MPLYLDANGREIECLYRFTRMLVGLTRTNRLGEKRMEGARKLEIGTPLRLVHEINNPIDRNAVLVYRDDDPTRDLGYMDARGARHFCSLEAAGATFHSQVYWVNRGDPDYVEVFLYLFQITKPRQHMPIGAASSLP